MAACRLLKGARTCTGHVIACSSEAHLCMQRIRMLAHARPGSLHVQQHIECKLSYMHVGGGKKRRCTWAA